MRGAVPFTKMLAIEGGGGENSGPVRSVCSTHGPIYVQQIEPLRDYTAAHKVPVHAVDLHRRNITRHIAYTALALGHFIDDRRPGDDHLLNHRGFVGERHLPTAIRLAAHELRVVSPQEPRGRRRRRRGRRSGRCRDRLRGVAAAAATTDEDERKK